MRISHRVRNVDRGGAGLDRGFHRAAQEIILRTAAVFGRPFNVIGVFARQRHRSGHRFQHRVRLHPQFELHVQRAGADEGVDAAAFRRLQCLRRAHDVAGGGTAQAADHRSFDRARDAVHAVKIADRGDRKPGFDHIDTKIGQRLRHPQLFIDVHRKARRLFAVAERGVKNDDAVVGQPAKVWVIDGHDGQPWK